MNRRISLGIWASLIVITGLLISGNAFGIAVCGDGICDTTANPSETETCPSDCGGGGGGSTTCELNPCDSCARPSAGTDNDGDGIPDRLEHDLAHKFFPAILLQGQDDDLEEAYLFRDEAIPYTVDSLSPTSVCDESFECLEIRYGTPYFRDTGDTFLGIGDHQGDSESYAALIMRTDAWSIAQDDAADWQMIRDFTPAHWQTSVDSSRVGVYGYCPPDCNDFNFDEFGCRDQLHCDWSDSQCSGTIDSDGQSCSTHDDQLSCDFAGGDCTWFPSACVANRRYCDSPSPVSSHRTLYAAEGKHGLYHTDAECDDGGFSGAADCPHNQFNMRDYKAGLLQNIGAQFNNGAFDTTIQYPDDCGLYEVWSGDDFAESSPYLRFFDHDFHWRLP